MARYLLVEFDGNDSADRMRAMIDDAEAKGKGFRVVGMFSKATKLCECPTRSDKSVKGSKYRWWLCPECRKPKKGAEQTLWNMLDDQDTPTKYLEMHIGVRWVWDKVLGRVKTARSVPRRDWK